MINENELFEFLVTCPENTCIYLGADSERWRDKADKWHATYFLVCVVHIASSKGCRIFAEKQTERDYDQKAYRPAMRLTTEAHKLAELHNRLKHVFDACQIPVRIHLDINPDEQHGSNCAATAALGYIKGVCGIEPELKPNAWAASYAADRAGDFL